VFPAATSGKTPTVAAFKPEYLVRGLPGHPLHPPLTDATIGAYTFATVAAIVSKAGLAEHGFATAWWLALVIGLISSALTVLTGLADWLTLTWGSELWKTATMHALAMVTATVFFVLAIVFGHGGYAAGHVGTGSLILTLVGFVALTTGGWLGGAITYVHGMRVLSLTKEPSLRAVAPLPHDEKVGAAQG
jgi:uncharacterized membrane protein